MMWHGIGLLVSLVSGFGMLAKMGMSWPWPLWIWIKVALWLVLGFLPVLAKKGVLSGATVVKLAILVGAALGYMGYFKTVF